MVLGEVEQILLSEGFSRARKPRITYCVETGKISRPPLDAVGNRQFNEQHLEELRRWFSSPHRAGKRPCSDRRQRAGVEG